MTEIEKKAEEYARAKNCENCSQAHLPPIYCLDVGNHCILCGHDKESYITGYEQKQKELEEVIFKLDKENEELKELIKNHTSYNDTIGNMLFEEENKSFQLWKKIKKEN